MHPHLLPASRLPPQSRFGDVVEMLCGRRLHRIFICDAEGRPMGVLSATDILRRIAQGP